MATGEQHAEAASPPAEIDAPDSLESLYEAYSGVVYGYVRGLGVPDPDDTVSEVFVSVVRSLPTFRGDEADFRRWLFTIAHRRAVDAHRHRSRRRREQVTDPTAIADLDSRHETPDEAPEHLSPGPATRALALLTPDQREVILLRVVADLSVEDAAEVMGKQCGAVKTVQRRALAALRRHLEASSCAP